MTSCSLRCSATVWRDSVTSTAPRAEGHHGPLLPVAARRLNRGTRQTPPKPGRPGMRRWRKWWTLGQCPLPRHKSILFYRCSRLKRLASTAFIRYKGSCRERLRTIIPPAAMAVTPLCATTGTVVQGKSSGKVANQLPSPKEGERKAVPVCARPGNLTAPGHSPGRSGMIRDTAAAPWRWAFAQSSRQRSLIPSAIRIPFRIRGPDDGSWGIPGEAVGHKAAYASAPDKLVREGDKMEADKVTAWLIG